MCGRRRRALEARAQHMRAERARRQAERARQQAIVCGLKGPHRAADADADDGDWLALC